MDDKLLNFLLVLVTGKVWSDYSDMTKWLCEDSYYKLDIWQNKKCMDIIRRQFLPSVFSYLQYSFGSNLNNKTKPGAP